MGGPPRLNINFNNLGGIAMPAMAATGLIGIIGVLIGLQCGGLDKCFAGPAPTAAVSVEPAAEPSPPEPRLLPDTAVAVAQPVSVVDPKVEKAKKAEALIGATFAMIKADDAGWLSGARAAAVKEIAEVEEGDGAGPPPTVPDEVQVAATPAPVAAPPKKTVPAGGETAADAVTAVAATPLDRPKPLEVAAFVEEPKSTAPAVKAAAEKKLADVADAAEPEAVEPEPAAEPEPKKQPKPKREAAVEEPRKVVSSGDTLTVAGAGVNVRAGPGKSQEKLFALAGGERVKIGENSKGWLKITDDQGRTGWVYKTYLN